MQPIRFPEANLTLTKPEGMTDDECSPLPVCDTGDTLVSAWQPDAHELRILNEGFAVWLTVHGRAQPPVMLSAYPPYLEPAMIRPKDVLVVVDEAREVEAALKSLDHLLDPADAQQAFIEGVIEKIADKRISQHEAMVMALGKTCTMMMEAVAELRLMAESTDAGDTAESRYNGALLATTYKALVDTMRQDIDRYMRNARMTRLITRPKIK